MKHIKITICFLAVLIVGSALATDRNVPQQYPTIQAAINACNDFDTVIVAPETYSGSGNRDINFNGKPITVRSTDPTDPQIVNTTVINCEGKGRGFAFNTGENADSKVAGLTITNGSGMVGGAIYCYNNSSPSITNCVIRNNSALFGGAIACANTDTRPKIITCKIVANSALFGGGGGVYLNGSSPTIKNCIISGNIAPDGGAIYSHNAGEPVITGCTICANTASASAGGIYCYKSSNMTVTNTILWGNAAVSAAEIFVGSSGDTTSVSLSYCDIQDPDNNIICGSGCIVNWGPGNIDSDPQFADSDNSDYHLLQDSPCIDAGDPDFTPEPGETDIDGSPRIALAKVDIGADEFTPLPDLEVTSENINFVPDSPVEPGTIVVVSTEVHNVGTEAAGSFVVRFFNGDPESGGIQIGSDQDITSLGYVSEVVSVAFTSLPEPHSYEIFVLADAAFQIEEGNEANNKAFRILTSGRDLALTSSDISFSAEVAGEVKVTVEVHNVGAEDITESIEVAFYNGDPETGGTYIGDATIIGGIAEGQSGIVEYVEWSNPPLGTYDIYVVVDPGGEITEVTKANNKAFNTLFATLDLTLISEDISFNPEPAIVGQETEISAYVHNSGFLAYEEFLVKFYDGDPDAGGTELGAEIVDSIAGLGCVQVSILSTFTNAGKHEIYVVADENNEVEETNEDNNLASDTLYVQYATIQEAIDGASPGDTVYIGPGLYDENVLIDKSITLIGAGSATTIIDGGGIGDVVLVTGDNVTIKGFTVQNSIGDGSGIHLQASGSLISENIITQCYFGIFCDYSSGSYIAHNTVTANSYGVYCKYASGDAIRYNTINYNTLYGARSCSSSLTNCFNWNYFTGNPIAYSYSCDPAVLAESLVRSYALEESVGSLHFGDNVLQDNEIGIEVKDTTADLELADNVIVGSDIGIICENADPLVSDNSLSSNNSAIYLINSSSLIEENTISENTTGIVYDEYSEPVLVNNTMSDNVANENAAPVADAGVDQTVECSCNSDQSTKVTLNGTDSYDPDVVPLTYIWTGLFVESPLAGAMPTVTLVDGCPGDYTITLVVNDGLVNSQTDEVVITVVDTTAPSISNLSADYPLAAIGQTVTFSAEVNDNCDDAVGTVWNFDDDTTSTLSSPNHAYEQPGIYTVTLTATDECGNTATDSIIIVVYDPAAGFTTGGGWFVPDTDSFVDGAAVTDTVSRANFGFIVKYKKGTDNPDGNLEFQYKAGDIDLKSSDMEWLVVQSTTKVRFKGKATVNGEGPYTFKVTAEDNGEPGTNDTFQIEIWLGVVIDTENGPPVPKHKAKGVLSGGNIQIHQK